MNTEKRVNKKYSAFEALFHREMSWMRQIPDLSNSKRKNLSQEFSLLFNEAEKIRNTILSEIDSRRDMKSIEAKFKKFIKEGDLVRVKKNAKS